MFLFFCIKIGIGDCKPPTPNIIEPVPSFILISVSFFLVYFRIIILNPPMRHSLSDYGVFVYYWGLILIFIIFLPLTILMTIIPVFIKSLLVRVMIYSVLGIVTARIVSPLLGPPSFSYGSASLLIIGSVLVIGVYKEYKRKNRGFIHEIA